MDPIDILTRYYGRHSKTFEILVIHGRQVAQKAATAAAMAAHLEPDLNFIQQAAMLHDIGILYTDSPALGCHGPHPYILHGVLGRELLDKIGLAQHGLVCERHVGVGISAKDIRHHHLPLPERDMVPVSIEEQIICYADKFFSKNGNHQLSAQEKPVKQIKRNLKKYGREKVDRFQKWVALFEGKQ